MKDEEKKKLTEADSLFYQYVRLWLSHKLLKRYIHGQSTPREKKIVEQWNAGQIHEDLPDEQTTLRCQELWNKIHRKISFRRRLTLTLQRTAAVLILLITAGGGVLLLKQMDILPFPQQQTRTVANIGKYHTGEEIRQINLPDGTVVCMNRNSRLRFNPREFNRRQREIWLEEGEAFFEVAKNPAVPFIIHYNKLNAVVKGTSFNIKNYSDLSETVLSVRTGIVEVKGPRRRLGMITPDRQLIYNPVENTYQIETRAWENAVGWTERRLVLNNADARELQLRIFQHFGYQLQFNGGLLKEARFRSSFPQDTPLEEVMKSICTVYHMKYSISGKTICLRSVPANEKLK